MQVMARTGTMSLPMPLDLDVTAELIEAGKTDPEIIYYLDGSDVEAYFIHETIEGGDMVERLVVLYDGSNEVVLPLVTSVDGQEDRLHLGEIRFNEAGDIIGCFRARVLAPTIVKHMQMAGGLVQLVIPDTLIKIHHEPEEIDAQHESIMGLDEEAQDRIVQAMIDDAKERDELDYEHHIEED